MNSLIKLWRMICCLLMMERNSRTFSIFIVCDYYLSFYHYIHRYKFQSSVGTFEDKTAVLSDNDKLWTELRHMHMREAIDKIMNSFKAFTEEHAVFQG